MFCTVHIENFISKMPSAKRQDRVVQQEEIVTEKPDEVEQEEELPRIELSKKRLNLKRAEYK